MILLYAKPELEQIRIESGFSVSELARLTGLSDGSIRHYESNLHGASPSSAKKIADVLGVKMSVIFTQKRV